MPDAKDRRALAICVILLVMATVAVLWTSAVLAAAVRLFEVIR
jgi:hypothetical protein